jgi:O-antigen/teichoic acid export membrane protein
MSKRNTAPAVAGRRRRLTNEPLVTNSPELSADRREQGADVRKGERVARNVGVSFAGNLWFAVIGLISTPYIVDRLGVDSYGLYVIVGTVVGYFSFLDLGLGSALVKYLAEYEAIADRNAMGRIIRTGSGLYLALGSLGACLIALLASVLADHVLTLPTSATGTAQIAFYFAALGFLVNLPAQVFSIVPVALQRFEIVFVRTIVFGTASVVATVVVLALGYGLLAVLAANLAVTILTAISFYRKTHALLPDISFLPSLNRTELRLLLGFGALKTLQRVSGKIISQLDMLVIGAFAPIAAVSYYALPQALSQRIGSLVTNVGAAVFPAASALASQQDERRSRELYLRAMKLSTLMALPMCSIMFVYADQIMRYWLSEAFELNSSRVLMILSLASLLFSLTTVPRVTLDATGRIRVSTIFSLIGAGTNLALMFALVPTIGFEGAAWAVLANAAIFSPLMLYYVHTRVLPISGNELVRASLLRPLLAAAVLWPPMVWAQRFATSLITVLVVCCASLAGYALTSILVGAIDRRDRALLRSLVQR